MANDLNLRSNYVARSKRKGRDMRKRNTAKYDAVKQLIIFCS